MANIKSAKKRILVNAKKAARNKAVRSQAIKALDALKSEMGRATTKGVYKKNTNARKIARMSKKVDALD